MMCCEYVRILYLCEVQNVHYGTLKWTYVILSLLHYDLHVATGYLCVLLYPSKTKFWRALHRSQLVVGQSVSQSVWSLITSTVFIWIAVKFYTSYYQALTCMMYIFYHSVHGLQNYVPFGKQLHWFLHGSLNMHYCKR